MSSLVEARASGEVSHMMSLSSTIVRDPLWRGSPPYFNIRETSILTYINMQVMIVRLMFKLPPLNQLHPHAGIGRASLRHLTPAPRAPLIVGT